MPQVQQHGSFEADADQIIRQLRNAFVTLMDQAGLASLKPLSLARELKIDKSLAWKIHRVVYPENSMDVVRHLPGTAGINRFIKALKTRDFNTHDVDKVKDAIADLEHMIETHCGDRATFQMMMNSVAAEPSEQLSEQHRQELVRGASYVWGAHSRVTIRADFVIPSPGGDGRMDIATIRGLVDLVRLRPNVPWVLSHLLTADNDMRERAQVSRRPIDPAITGVDKASLMTEFCSKPLPETRRVPGASGFLNEELVEGKVGATGVVTCITGERAEKFASYYCNEHNTIGRHHALIRTPSDMLVFDLFVHRDLPSAMKPQFYLYSNLECGPRLPAAELERYRLPNSEVVKSLGAFPPVAATPEIPRYADLIGYVFRQMGWNPEDFAGFRVQMRYPPIPAAAVLQWPLAERPA